MLQKGKVYRITGGKFIQQAPRYTTSRLPYYLRATGPIGTQTKFDPCDESPWTDVPLHHPFVDLASLERVQDSLQVCVYGIVTHQPGLVSRDTAYGPGEVCNAVLRRGEHDIMCGFWRDAAKSLSRYQVGDAVAI